MAELLLPPGVHYTCLRCGECCRRLDVTLTDIERARLLEHDWSATLPSLSPERSFARIRRPRGRQAWRLRPAPTGACPFLADGQLCLVHATLGYGAKPFAGRLFPFTFTITPIGVFVGARFSCLAVARGHGRPLEEQRRDLERLFEEYRGVYAPPIEPERVRFFGRYELGWRDIVRLEDQLLAFLLRRDLDLPRRLLACRRLVRRFASQVLRRGETSRVGVDPDGILAEVSQGAPAAEELSAMERVLLRLLTATFVSAALPAYRELPLRRRLGTRLGNLRQRVLMALGRGRVRLPDLPEAIPIRDIRNFARAVLDADSAATLERYFVAKIASQAFFGRAFFRRAFAVGFDFLATSYGAILWLARAHALAAGRPDLGTEDVEYGVRQVDYGFNYLPAFGGTTEQLRMALFGHWATPEKLLGDSRF